MGATKYVAQGQQLAARAKVYHCLQQASFDGQYL
jgi:hypothetical protein